MRLFLPFLFLSVSSLAQPTLRPPRFLMSAPAGTLPAQIDRAGRSVLPNGRFITPRGRQIETAPHPYGLLLAPDHQTVITANSGIKPFSISIIRKALSASPTVQQVPEGAKGNGGILEACFMGLAVSPDVGNQPNKTVFVAGGETNKIMLFDLATGKPTGAINCAWKTATASYQHGYIGDLALSRDGKTLYALDQIGFRMMIIDVATRKIRHNVPTGRYPFGITLSPDEKTAYVANVGVFEYKPFTDLDPKNLKETAHDFPASKYGSETMRNGDAKAGIPALGDPNAPEAFSVWRIDLTQPTPTVTAKIKTGFLVGEMVEDFPAVGGSSPNSVVATDRYVFVSNGNNDCVSVIDVTTNAVLKNIALSPDPRLGNLRGVIPFGLALSPDQKRLYVAEAGINAVGVIDVATLSVLGHIPTGWFPAKLAVTNQPGADSPNGKPGHTLIVANAKGFGSGPNGGQAFKLDPRGSYIGNLMNGTVSVMDVPTDVQLAADTRQVIANNFSFRPVTDLKPGANPIPAFAGQNVVGFADGKSPIKHIVFIAKENRTYDEVFGQMKTGNGDSTLARYGLRASVRAQRGSPALAAADVMPNHIALARRFAMSDNFFCDSDVSADGHRWLVNTYPNEWVETGTAAAYGGKRNLRDTSDAPGNLMNGTVSVMDVPTDVQLAADTRQVIANNFSFRPVTDLKPSANPIPAFAGQNVAGFADGKSPIKHIVFIAKENRTYDEVFGQMKTGNGDSTLARYGLRASVRAQRGSPALATADVMPNHIALARRFAMSDNFFCDSDVSADGHRWLVNTYPNEWVETGTAAAYGGKRNLRDTSDAPGNLSFYGSAGSIYPEDYNEGGSMWEHLERWKIDFFNFGFGVEMAGAFSDSTMKYIGEKYTINYPLPAPLYDRTSRKFPTYNTAIPDQFRTDVFMQEFTEKWMPVVDSAASPRAGGGTLPSVVTLMIPNDHGSRPRPKAGYPYTESYMADNDLALGRAVEFLSKTPYWKNMLIVVLEDDPQGGVDHVDAHRSPLLVISPWTKKNYVGPVHYSFGSVFKTFWNILGIPYLNQYDAGATDLSDLFTSTPDFTPYNARPVDVRLFDPQKALDPFDEKFDWKAFSQSEELDRVETMQERRAEEDERQRKPVKKKK